METEDSKHLIILVSRINPKQEWNYDSETQGMQ